MSFFYVIILAVVQGVAEFLPISSSGHLIFLNQLFNVEVDFMFLSILLHVATLLSVVVAFRKELIAIFKHPFCDTSKKIIISFLPTALIAFLLKGFADSLFSSGNYLSITFALTAVLLVLTELFAKRTSKKNEISYFSAVVMGAVQGIAIIPGLSRSGTTIASGVFCGENKENTAKFSFLMSIPVIVASFAYDLIFHFDQIYIADGMLFPVIVAFVVAFFTGLFAIKFMLKAVNSKRYYFFSIYLTLLAIINLFI